MKIRSTSHNNKATKEAGKKSEAIPGKQEVHGTRTSKTSRAPFSGEQRMNIRMSKRARGLQAAAAEVNWNDMAKMLFRADPHQGRSEEIRRLLIPGSAPVSDGDPGTSYNSDQFQSILVLMLIFSIAEKRTQELYHREFSQRCDAISHHYGLKDDQYWNDGEAPREWEDLNRQFEQQSLQVLLQTMKEYGQTEIADVVQTEGVEHFFGIIKSVRSQFMRVLENFAPGTMNHTELRPGSLPETPQS